MTFKPPLSYLKDPESNLPPSYIAAHPVGLHNSLKAASTPARNYVFVEKTGKEAITGTFHINTDLLEPFGLFDTEEERKVAPNLFLQARFIDIDLIVSGSKKAEISVKDLIYSSDYSRFIIRLHAAGDATSMTPINLNIEQRDSGRALVAIMQPEAFKRFVEGAAQVSKAVMEMSTNLLVPNDIRRLHSYRHRQERTRWLVLPSALAPLTGGEATARKASFLAAASKLVWHITGMGPADRAIYHSRRKVCFYYEYENLREAMITDEARTSSQLRAIGLVWKAALAALLICFSWTCHAKESPLPWMAVFSIFAVGLIAGVAEAFEFVC